MELNLSELIIKNKITCLGFIALKSQLKNTKELLNKLEMDGYMENYIYDLKEFNEVFALKICQIGNPKVYEKIY